ncbi:pantoate--beta-alanine ligase [Jeotgalibacillus sp. ET6]|uniref:pantoate--beta-alanine ligase n=1 Tax=Jeotgalibacillus sp. ET6 TaxID=3037260 RepID=UPI0024183438|nr:pantoate--beta-alanine ligase [Jeotgalibacillus sp. ET6]MDG5470621.1 pantoate--beta-alanine ligase [Jeotgalibacillus sp. ET6]
MIILTSAKQMIEFARNECKLDKTIGFVPTMGFLHEGHLSLVKRSLSECDTTVMSIFVNPLQFGPNEDFDKYPRDLERDTILARQSGVDVLFIPEAKEIYPSSLSISMKAKQRTDVMCGASRPGHFDGVITVLTILFHLVQPDRAYFGQKDAQQAAVVQGLADSLMFPLEIVPVETVREEDGLAKSSRNVYLTDDERNEASILYQALMKGKIQLPALGIEGTVKEMTEMINSSSSGQIDYIEILQFPDLTPVEKLRGKIIIALAVQFEKARLIDNVIFTLEEE